MYIFNGLGRNIRYTYDDFRAEAFYLIEDICAILKISRKEILQHVSWGDMQGLYYIDEYDEQVRTDVISQQAFDRILAASTHPKAKAYLSWLENGGDDSQTRRKMRRRKPRTTTD